MKNNLPLMNIIRNAVISYFSIFVSLNGLGQLSSRMHIALTNKISTISIFQSWWFYFIIITSAAGLALLLYLAKIRQKKAAQKRQSDANQAESNKLDAELKALRSKMNPHFIFNSLNSIQELVLIEDKARSYESIALFAKLVRYTLNYSNNDFIPIRKELEFLSDYLSLEKLRFEADFEYSIRYIGSKNISIPLMLIQPFIDYAMCHSLFHKNGQKQLDISFEFTDQLICTIRDNGIGHKAVEKIQKRQKRSNGSAALNAIDQRINLINKQLGKKMGSFNITDLHNGDLPIGTKVEIILPFKPLKKIQYEETLVEKSLQ